MNQINILKKSDKTIGLISSIYLSISYIIGLIIFIVILKYPEITEVIDKVKILINMDSMVFITNLIMYILFGPMLILFILILKKSINTPNDIIINFSSIVGFIWAGSLTASGMIANASIEPIKNLFLVNPDQALIIWQIMDSVTLGIGNGNGEILGGLMTIGFSISMLKSENYSKGFAIYGLLVGFIGVASLIPILVNLAGLFGVLQIFWFTIIGITFCKNNKKLS